MTISFPSSGKRHTENTSKTLHIQDFQRLHTFCLYLERFRLPILETIHNMRTHALIIETDDSEIQSHEGGRYISKWKWWSCFTCRSTVHAIKPVYNTEHPIVEIATQWLLPLLSTCLVGLYWTLFWTLPLLNEALSNTRISAVVKTPMEAEIMRLLSLFPLSIIHLSSINRIWSPPRLIHSCALGDVTFMVSTSTIAESGGSHVSAIREHKHEGWHSDMHLMCWCLHGQFFVAV